MIQRIADTIYGMTGSDLVDGTCNQQAPIRYLYAVYSGQGGVSIVELACP